MQQVPEGGHSNTAGNLHTLRLRSYVLRYNNPLLLF
jgi:hypothetical protein